MGEFWLNSPTHDKLNDMLDAVSGAHIYGKSIIQAEGFTEVRGTWDEHPGMLKALLDRNYALGINRLFYHVYVHNPWLDRKPGMTLDGIGLFFQRDQTWWNKGAKALSDYATRCQALLQYGHPVVDIAVSQEKRFQGVQYCRTDWFLLFRVFSGRSVWKVSVFVGRMKDNLCVCVLWALRILPIWLIRRNG